MDIKDVKILQTRQVHTRSNDSDTSSFVLEKSIFNNVFEKDIRRVYIYKKAERLAKAIHLIAPAFALSTALRNRIDAIAVGLVDGAILPPSSARDALSRELLALSSVLSIARTSSLLSSMNADLIAREAHLLLQEVAAYEEPRLFLDETPTLANLLKQSEKRAAPLPRGSHVAASKAPAPHQRHDGGDRRESIISVIKDKGTVYIKDISIVVRDVSEKTIQRELQKLVQEGVIAKKGERRWTAYSFIG